MLLQSCANLSKVANSANGNSQHKRRERQEFDRIARRLKVKVQHDFYNKVTVGAIRRLKDIKLPKQYSLYKNLKLVYPEFSWQPFLFKPVQSGFWKDVSNQRQLFDWIGEQFGLETQEDWYKMTGKRIYDISTGFFHNYYTGSLVVALRTIYSQYQWNPLRFAKVPHYSWSQQNNQRELFDWLGEQLGVCNLDDWYKVSCSQVAAVAGGLFSHYFHGSLISALRSVYPEHNWDEWMFKRLGKKYWTRAHSERPKLVLERLKEKYKIQKPSQWFVCTIDRSFFVALSFTELFTKNIWTLGSKVWWSDKDSGDFLPRCKLASDLLHHRGRSFLAGNSMTSIWNLEDLYNPTQSMLASLTEIQTHFNINGHSIDCYLPEVSLAFEFQGGQHHQQIFRGCFVQ